MFLDKRWPPVEGKLYDQSASLQTMVANVRRNRGTRAQRTSRVEMIRHVTIQVRDGRDEMAKDLAKKDRWLTKNPKSKKFTEREDAWLVDLQQYEAACDAVKASEANVTA